MADQICFCNRITQSSIALHQSVALLRIRRLKARLHQVWEPEYPIDDSHATADRDFLGILQIFPDRGDLRFGKMERFHGLTESGSPQNFGREWIPLVLKWPRQQAIRSLAFAARPDYVWPILVISEAIDDHRASVGKNGLNLEHTPHRVNIPS